MVRLHFNFIYFFRSSSILFFLRSSSILIFFYVNNCQFFIFSKSLKEDFFFLAHFTFEISLQNLCSFPKTPWLLWLEIFKWYFFRDCPLVDFDNICSLIGKTVSLFYCLWSFVALFMPQKIVPKGQTWSFKYSFWIRTFLFLV